jgi:hypothetical protein
MKKFLLVLLVFALVSAFAFAVDLMKYPPPVKGGDFLINAGIGFGSYGGSGWNMQIPPIWASFDYCLSGSAPISLGGLFAFYQYGWDYYSYNYTYMAFLGRGNWHWNFPVDWLDFYTGLSLGYLHFSTNDKYNTWNYGGFDWGIQVGSRFFLSRKFGFVLELGYPMWLKGGLTFRI